MKYVDFGLYNVTSVSQISKVTFDLAVATSRSHWTKDNPSLLSLDWTLENVI